MITEKRKQAHLSQKELASKLGVSQQCVAKWELGASNPRAKLLPKLALALNCTVDELLREDPVEDDQSDREDPERVCGNCKHIVEAERILSDCALGYGETWSGAVACPEFEKR